MSTKSRSRTQQLIVEFGFKVIQLLERLVSRYSLVENRAFFDRDELPWTAVLEANWLVIRDELDRVLRFRDDLPNIQDLSPDQEGLTTDDRWKAYFFSAFGLRADGNCARCPRTARVLESVPGVTTALFSVLGPHKRLPEHRGVYKGVLRCHLALVVPDPASTCGISVGGQTAHWEEGKCLVFDDSVPHEAWNDTEADRVVLLLDVLRPLRPPISWLNRGVIKAIGCSPFVRGSHDRYLEWERVFEARWAAAQ